MFKSLFQQLQVDKQEAICMALKSISHTTGMHLLARFSKVVLRLALLSWPVIGYSLQMLNADLTI